MIAGFTILTDPIPYGSWRFGEVAKRFLRRIKYAFIQFSFNSPPFYRGHPAVTRSLIEGLNILKTAYNYNPRKIKDLYEIVLVLSGTSTLNQAIFLKKQGFIKKIIAGPNIVIFSSDFDNLIAADEIDYVITPSEIVSNLYLLDNPGLLGKIKSWPAGVNPYYWKPNESIQRNQILIYDEYFDKESKQSKVYLDFLVANKFDVHILNYGNFTQEEYRWQLNKSFLMIGFSKSESQGIAWTEAWACDVPTFICYNDNNVYKGRVYHCSPAPYLNDNNGLFFSDYDDFVIKFNDWLKGDYHFKPRQWCLNNMTDSVCALKLLEIINLC